MFFKNTIKLNKQEQIVGNEQSKSKLQYLAKQQTKANFKKGKKKRRV